MKWRSQSWSIYIDPSFKRMPVCVCVCVSVCLPLVPANTISDLEAGAVQSLATFLISVGGKKRLFISSRPSFTFHFFQFLLSRPISRCSSRDSLILSHSAHFPMRLLTLNSSHDSQEKTNAVHIVPAQFHWKRKQIPIKAFHAHRHLCYIIYSKGFYFIIFFPAPCDGRWNEPKTKFSCHPKCWPPQQQEAQQDVWMQTDGLSMWLKTFPNFEKQADNTCFDHIIITSQALGSCCSACWEAASYIQSSVFNEDQKQNHLLAEFVHTEWWIGLLGLFYFEVDINNEN